MIFPKSVYEDAPESVLEAVQRAVDEVPDADERGKEVARKYIRDDPEYQMWEEQLVEYAADKIMDRVRMLKAN